MKCLYLDKKLEMREIPEPNPALGESLVKVIMAGICRTDIELVKGYMGFKGVPGHEFVGIVEKSDKEELIGKRVVGEINSGCGKCDFCARGLERHCSERDVLGILGRNGAFAEKLVLSDRNLFVVPDNVTDEAVVFVEPVAACYEILEQNEGAPDGRVLIVGDGKLAALAAMVLKAEGCDVTLAGKHPEKMKIIEEYCGITTFSSKSEAPASCYHFVVECSGRQSGLEYATTACRPRGTIFLKSTFEGSVTMNMAQWVINEISIIGSRCGRFQTAIDAISSGKVDPGPFVEKVFLFERAIEAFEYAKNAAFGKILLKY